MPLPLEPASAATIGDEQTVRQQLSTGLMKIGLAIRHHAWAGGERHGLSPSQGQILTLLLHRDDSETRLSDLARDLAVTQATASVAVRALTAKGLVEKARAASDARAVSLRLTAEGREQARRAQSWTEFLLEAAGELDEREQAVFQRSIVKMIRSMQIKGQIPVARMCVSCRFFRPNAHPGERDPHHCTYVDAPFGDRHLRLDCVDYQPAPPSAARAAWAAFADRPPGM